MHTPPCAFSSLRVRNYKEGKELKGTKDSPWQKSLPCSLTLKTELIPHPGSTEGHLPLLQVAPGLSEPSREQWEGAWTISHIPA